VLGTFSLREEELGRNLKYTFLCLNLFMKHGCVLAKKDNLLSDGYEKILLDAT
jgi:hypothetical protein